MRGKGMPLDMHAAHYWDSFAMAALGAITGKYHHGKDVEILGLSDASTLLRERLGGKLGAGGTDNFQI